MLPDCGCASAVVGAGQIGGHSRNRQAERQRRDDPICGRPALQPRVDLLGRRAAVTAQSEAFARNPRPSIHPSDRLCGRAKPTSGGVRGLTDVGFAIIRIGVL
jgi:hypothetical protein